MNLDEMEAKHASEAEREPTKLTITHLQIDATDDGMLVSRAITYDPFTDPDFHLGAVEA